MGDEGRKLRRQLVSQENIVEAWGKMPVGEDNAISEEWCITNRMKPPKPSPGKGRGKNRQVHPKPKGKTKNGKEVDDYMFY